MSKWGGDPAWLGAPVENRALELVQLDNLLRTLGLDDRPEPGRPSTAPQTLPLASLPERPTVTVLGYTPQYNPERKLWYVDVALDPGRRSLAVRPPGRVPLPARQHHRLPPVSAGALRLRPAHAGADDERRPHRRPSRAGRRQRPDRDSRRPRPGSGSVAASHWFAQAVSANRQVVARLQRRDPAIPTDLGWKTVAATELVIRGRGANGYEAAWVGELDAGTTVPLARPGGNPNWRVTVEEWERLPGDPPPGGHLEVAVGPIWERRLVYADEVHL